MEKGLESCSRVHARTEAKKSWSACFGDRLAVMYGEGGLRHMEAARKKYDQELDNQPIELRTWKGQKAERVLSVGQQGGQSAKGSRKDDKIIF